MLFYLILLERCILFNKISRVVLFCYTLTNIPTKVNGEIVETKHTSDLISSTL